jgi:hypothetical protein
VHLLGVTFETLYRNSQYFTRNYGHSVTFGVNIQTCLFALPTFALPTFALAAEHGA